MNMNMNAAKQGASVDLDSSSLLRHNAERRENSRNSFASANVDALVAVSDELLALLNTLQRR